MAATIARIFILQLPSLHRHNALFYTANSACVCAFAMPRSRFPPKQNGAALKARWRRTRQAYRAFGVTLTADNVLGNRGRSPAPRMVALRGAAPLCGAAFQARFKHRYARAQPFRVPFGGVPPPRKAAGMRTRARCTLSSALAPFLALLPAVQLWDLLNRQPLRVRIRAGARLSCCLSCTC